MELLAIAEAVFGSYLGAQGKPKKSLCFRDCTYCSARYSTNKIIVHVGNSKNHSAMKVTSHVLMFTTNLPF